MAVSPIVSLRGVSVRHPGTLVLRSIDLTVHPAEAVAVFGANGSGKTTLLRVLATLLRPTGGTGTVLGAPIGSPAVEAIRPMIGLVAHEPALYPNLTLEENLDLVARLSGRDHRSAGDALTLVGLAGASNRLVARSSNGMKRRVEFARMLITRPDLLLLDEAHVGLDPAAGQLVDHLVRDVTSRGGAAVIVSHERERVRLLATRSVELSQGMIGPVAT